MDTIQLEAGPEEKRRMRYTLFEPHAKRQYAAYDGEGC
jgi:hypothetical protein